MPSLYETLGQSLQGWFLKVARREKRVLNNFLKTLLALRGMAEGWCVAFISFS